MTDDLASIVDAELRQPVPTAVSTLAATLAARAGGAAVAVLFYGSALRDTALDGVLDFYVLTDRPVAWPGSRLAALASRLLPPGVGYLEAENEGPSEPATLRCKFAVMTLAQFRAAMSVRRIDTTLWARFSQPAACVWLRGDVERGAVTEAVAAAGMAAARWAALLGPKRGDAPSFWRELYRRTYAAELRVERGSRPLDIVARDEARYARLLPAAWRAAGIAFETALPASPGDAAAAPPMLDPAALPGLGRAAAPVLEPAITAAERSAAERAWRWRQRLGRPLNLLRLLKAAATFDNAIDYVAWKIERHSGYRIEPSDFQRRHPLLAAPALYLRLRSRGVLR